MGSEQQVPDAGPARTVEPASLPAPASPTGTAAQVAAAGAGDGLLDRARVALGGPTSRRVVGWALLAGWALWLVATWVVQPRLVAQDLLADDLAQGRVTGYRVVTVEEHRGAVFAGPYRIDVWPASDEQDGTLDGAADGDPVSVAYWVDAPVAGLRVLDPNGLGSDVPAVVVGRLAAAGVPETGAGEPWFRSLAQRAGNLGTALVVVTVALVVAGPRPRRGTRWFWFWLAGGPLCVGVPWFAVAELLRPGYEQDGAVHPPGVAGRRSGLTGLVLAVALSFLVTAVSLLLTGVSPIWFIRG